jgi:hypothetical protein
MQDIASRQQSATQARSVVSLGDRPLIVLSSENPPGASRYRSVWLELQTDMARLSSRGQQMIVGDGDGDLIYQVPEAIVGAARQVSLRLAVSQEEKSIAALSVRGV